VGACVLPVVVSSSDYTLAAGQTLSAVNTDPITLLVANTLDPTPSITIAGDVEASSSGAPTTGGNVHGVEISSTGPFGDPVVMVATGGVLDVDTRATWAGAAGIDAGSIGPRIVNEGAIKVLAATSACGIVNYGTMGETDPAVVNDGSITVYSDGDALGVGMVAGQLFVNSGGLQVNGAGHVFGVTVGQSDGEFLNSPAGEIRVYDMVAPFEGVGVFFQATLGPQGFLNQGLISADIAFKGDQPDFVLAADNVFRNQGEMDGAVQMGVGGQMLANAGLVRGAVDMGAGDDVYDGGLGQTIGMVAGGDGADSLAGGAMFDYLQGNAGNDTASGGDGDDWVVGGRDDDRLSGDAGADIVYGNLGNDTLDGGDGNDIVRGGQGDDMLAGSAGDDWISGDRGNDTESGGAGADTFHFFDGAGFDRVQDFNAAEGDRVQVDAGTNYSLRQGELGVYIETDTSQMLLVGAHLDQLPSGWIVVD